MKRKGIHKPTVEDCIEMSGIETLHPGGFALTKRTAEIAGLKTGMKVLDVSSGRGTQSIFYAKEFGVEVVGLDLSNEMIETARESAAAANLERQVTFQKGDSQNLPFEDNTFDVVINECAVGIPDDSQQVLNEMMRVLKPGGAIAIHESTWKKEMPASEKDEISERYGTTPLDFNEWQTMLTKAGAQSIITEFEQWSQPEMFWKVRKDRDVKHHSKVLSLRERLPLLKNILSHYGLKGVFKALKNEKIFYKAIIDGKLGYGLYKGTK
ncbi:MAG: methyltransferase domain-containing protein [bacterium]|nr:methyltransferase domain-containing protein [bacterium]